MVHVCYIESLTAEVSSLTKELAGLEGLVASLSGDLGGLESTVSGLGGEVDALGETVGGACTQLSLLTGTTDELIGSVAGISLDTLLAVLLEVPPLPATLGEFECV